MLNCCTVNNSLKDQRRKIGLKDEIRDLQKSLKEIERPKKQNQIRILQRVLQNYVIQ